MSGMRRRIAWPFVSSDFWRDMHGAALLSFVLGMIVASATPELALAQEGPAQESVPVVVENRTNFDAQIYALQGGHMVPLGFVSSMESASLALPPTLAESGASTQLVADLIGTTDWHKSDAVNIGPSAEVEFTVESDLERSVVNVRG